MTFQETMKTLEAAGTAQNRKIYARHGVGAKLFGVSFADLYKLQKKIKKDHALARQLWKTANYDARNLALLIADPQQATAAELDEWVSQIDCHGHGDLLSRFLAAPSPHAKALAEKWARSRQDYVAQTGWNTLAAITRDASLPDSYFEEHLRTIERVIHSSENRTRYAMNGALIAIGIRSPSLQKLALAAAGRIGKVEVDHGETGCKTPDAVAYIKKTAGRKKR
jgi:3-methyladenine DNA glycosylase AlkD